MRAVQLQALLCLIIFTFTTKLHSFTLKRLLDVLNHKRSWPSFALPRTICETISATAAAANVVSDNFSTKGATENALAATMAEMIANEKMNITKDVHKISAMMMRRLSRTICKCWQQIAKASPPSCKNSTYAMENTCNDQLTSMEGLHSRRSQDLRRRSLISFANASPGAE